MPAPKPRARTLSGAVEYPEQNADYFAAEAEWQTASRISVCAGVRYNIRKFYVDLQGEYPRAFNVKSVGRNRASARLAVGYRF